MTKKSYDPSEEDIQYALQYFEKNIASVDDLIKFWMIQGKQIYRGPQRERLSHWMKAFELS